MADSGYPQIQNPFGVEALRPVLDLFLVALVTIPLGILGSALSLVFRYRRSGPTERLQIKWLAAAAAVVAVLYAITMFMTLAADADWGSGYQGVVSILQNVAIISFALVPISIAVAVLRYRLYDVNVVIRKAVIVAAIAVFFTIVYAAIVGGIGALVESRATTTLSFIAAAVVALLFQPALGRARRIADRLVYGTRATPYELLAEFSDRVAETYADDEVLPRMARVVGEGIGAARADVWLRTHDRLRVAASWPFDGDRSGTVPLDRDGALPELPEADAAFPVEHRGELLGALAVAMPANDPMDEAKAKLVADLAAQAGLVLRNVRLTEDLRARLEDLKRAQKRLVAAQDEERRKLERNIHDGAQQQLVALSVRLRLAQSLIARDPDGAEAMLGELQTQTTETLEDLRDLARGIYPPLLADKGLRGGARGAGPQVRRPGRDRARRRRPVLPGGGGDRVLLGPRGPAERREVRRSLSRRGSPRPERRRAAVRGHRRRTWVRLERHSLRDRPPGDRRPPRRHRRSARGALGPGPRHHGRRADPRGHMMRFVDAAERAGRAADVSRLDRPHMRALGTWAGSCSRDGGCR